MVKRAVNFISSYILLNQLTERFLAVAAIAHITIARIFWFISGIEAIYTTNSQPKKNRHILTTFLRYEFSKFMAQKKVENRKKFMVTKYFAQDKNHFYESFGSSIAPSNATERILKKIKVWKLWPKTWIFLSNFKNSQLFFLRSKFCANVCIHPWG